MQFRVLGPVEVWTADGAPVPLAGDRQRLLLATLLARRGELVSGDALVEALWGDRLPDHPVAALQSQVHRLRRLLLTADNGAAGDWALESRQRGYLLDVGSERLDAVCFDRLTAESRDLEPEERMQRLDEALALWRGSAYEGLIETDASAAGDPVRLEAIRLDEQWAAAVETWADVALECGRASEVVARIDGFVRRYPLRERARAALMRALYLRGRQSAALTTYADYRERICEELGLEPSAAMQRLEVAILRHEVPDPAAGPAEVPAQRTAPEGPGLDRMHVAYVRLGQGHQIAVGQVGSGPTVVGSLGWVSSLAVVGSGRDPRSSLLQRLVASCGLTLYDRYGTGLSPGPVRDFGLDPSVEELEAVVERAGPPVDLLAMSQAGPVAIALAARRPDLVRRLVLWGTYADGPATFRRPEVNASVVALVRAHWGLGSRMLADLYQPGVSTETALHFARVLRDSAPPDTAAEYLEQVFGVDVSALLPKVAAPALVLHYRGDRVIPFVGGQQLAAGLPDCSFLPLEGRYHLPQAGDLDRAMEVITEFLGRTPAAHRPVG